MGFFSALKNLGWLLDNGIWIVMIAAFVVFAACIIIERVPFFGKLASRLPPLSLVKIVAAAVFGITAAIKIFIFISFLLTAQSKIKDLEEQLAGKQLKINELEQNAGRKQEQANAVTDTDT